MTPSKRLSPALFSGFSQLWDDFLNEDLFGLQRLQGQVPALNVREETDHYLLEMSAPGRKKEDFQISLHKGQLTIAAKWEQEETEEEAGKYQRREFVQQSFQRSLRLPEDVRTDHIRASYEDGMLRLTIPRQEAHPESDRHTIEIQ